MYVSAPLFGRNSLLFLTVRSHGPRLSKTQISGRHGRDVSCLNPTQYSWTICVTADSASRHGGLRTDERTRLQYKDARTVLSP